MANIRKKSVFPTQLVGQDRQFIDFTSLEQPVHRELVPVLRELKASAAQHGFELTIASGFRSFDQQLRIWNEKAEGIRPVLDENEKPVTTEALTKSELMWAILRWSALPGASRHHWGTEIDVFDRSALTENYQLQLTVAETLAGGVFERFYVWLDAELKKSSCHFFRPYLNTKNGVAYEPWHLSYKKLADEFQANLSIELLHDTITRSNIALKKEILDNIKEIYQRFVIGGEL